jgi:hypothetical protein
MSDKYVDEAGEYVATVKEPGNGWFGEAGEKKTPFIRIPLIVSTKGKQHGREIVWRGYLTADSVKRTVKTLAKTFNFNGDLSVLAEEENNNYEDSVLVGKECAVVCEEEYWEDKVRIKAKWLNPLKTDTRLPVDRVNDIVQRLNDLSIAAAMDDEEESSQSAEKPKRNKPKATEKYEGRTKDDDGEDIPF